MLSTKMSMSPCMIYRCVSKIQEHAQDRKIAGPQSPWRWSFLQPHHSKNNAMVPVLKSALAVCAPCSYAYTAPVVICT